MSATVQLRNALWVMLTSMWSAAAWAAQATFAGDLSDIPPAAVAISVLLALIGGAANTAAKIASPDVVVKSIPLEVIKDILTSIVVGLLIFCLGAYMEWSSVVQAGLITLGGYGGSRVLEPALSRLIKWVGGAEVTQ